MRKLSIPVVVLLLCCCVRRAHTAEAVDCFNMVNNFRLPLDVADVYPIPGLPSYNGSSHPCHANNNCKCVQGCMSCMNIRLNSLSFLSQLTKEANASQSHVNTNLTSLLLGYNNLTALDSTVNFNVVPDLIVLSLISNQITYIAEGLFKPLTKLAVLALRSNLLTQLPSYLFDGQLLNIRSLYVGRNSLGGTFNPAIITAVNNFSNVLDFGYNDYASVEGQFVNLECLFELKLHNNKFQNFPLGTFDLLTSLQVLYLNNNPLTELATTIFEKLTKLSQLMISYLQITELPSNLFVNQRELTQIMASSNNLTSIPTTIFQDQTQLRVLDLSYNNLDTIPTNMLKNAEQLDVVDLAGNNFYNITQSEMVYNGLMSDRTGFVFVSSSNCPVTCRFEEAGYVCYCSRGYVETSLKTCELPSEANYEKEIKRTIILSVVCSFVVIGIVIFGVFTICKNFDTLRSELGVHRKLLGDAQAEMSELLEAWEISQDEIVLHNKIDSGSFGEVWTGTWEGITVAIKRMHKIIENTANAADFDNEVQFLRKCRHRNIVKFFGAGTWAQKYSQSIPFLVVEFLERGSMEVIFRQKTELSWQKKTSLLLDIQSGMQYLHALGRIHRDMKPGNILVSKSWRAKVADLGTMEQCLLCLPKDIAKVDCFKCSQEGFVERGMGTMVNREYDLVGTPMYMAPEVLRQQSISPAVDVWSFGIILWEMATMEPPDISKYHSDVNLSGPFLTALSKAWTAGYRYPLDEHACGCPPGYKQMIASCMQLSPLARPNFGDLGEALECIAEKFDSET
eukprot:m.134162 g.134162  ORF g.134162 m.134162 type:complete len:792 (+) comp14689_c0_seq6:167-2542(+)